MLRCQRDRDEISGKCRELHNHRFYCGTSNRAVVELGGAATVTRSRTPPSGDRSSATPRHMRRRVRGRSPGRGPIQAPLHRRARRAQHLLPHRGIQSRAVVVDVDDDARRLRRQHARATSPTCRHCRAGCRASPRGPRAARGPRRPADTSTSNVSAALGVEPLHRAHQRSARVGDVRARVRRHRRRGRARLREMRLDLPPHPVDLLADRRRPDRAVRRRRRVRCPARAPRAASSGRARDRRPSPRRGHAPLALVEQRVQVVDQRLDLLGILAVEPRAAAVAHGREPLTQDVETATGRGESQSTPTATKMRAGERRQACSGSSHAISASARLR